MRKIFSVLLLACLFIPAYQLAAQTSEYPVKNIKGTDYYVYKVQTSEGLLAIGRKFEVSATEITKLNPEIQSGLKPGQEILIPIHKKFTAQSDDGFIKHKVEKKQTLFAISHKYNVSQEDIEKLNPEVRNGGLKEGMILNIPDSVKIKKLKAVEKPEIKPVKSALSGTKIIENKVFTHKVLPKETLYSICKHYSVDLKEVEKLNPGVESGLTVDTELKIPQNSKNKALIPEIVQVQEPASEPKAVEKPVIKEQIQEKRTVKLAFLLPFMLEQAKKDAVLERFQNFYAGALMAVEAAKERGISFEIYTYDTDKTEDKMNEVLNNPELKSVDLIIGPAFSNQIPLIGTFANENKVNTLIPFSSKVPDIENNPYLFQFNPGFDNELKYLNELLNSKYKNANIVFAEIQGVNPMDDGRIREASVKGQLLRLRRSFGLLELSSPDNADLTSQLKPDKQNLIIFNTDKFSAVSPYLTAVNLAAANYNLIMLEQFSWRTQVEKKPDCLYISPFLSAFNEEQATEYSSRFDQFFGKDLSADSPRYDMLGFDLTNYFISYIHRYGKNYASKIGNLTTIPFIQSQPKFEKVSTEAGYVNQMLYSAEVKGR